MAKISANYEVVYIIDPAQGEEAVAATVAKFQSLAEQNATDVVVDEWGKRRLAYAIDYKTEGYYVYVAFNGASELPKELSRNLGINENVIRSQIVKLLEKKSSVKPRPVRVAPVSEDPGRGRSRRAGVSETSPTERSHSQSKRKQSI